MKKTVKRYILILFFIISQNTTDREYDETVKTEKKLNKAKFISFNRNSLQTLNKINM